MSDHGDSYIGYDSHSKATSSLVYSCPVATFMFSRPTSIGHFMHKPIQAQFCSIVSLRKQVVRMQIEHEDLWNINLTPG